MLRRLGRIVLVAFLVSVTAVGGCVFFAVEDEARVLPDEPVLRAELERMRTIFRREDPRRPDEEDLRSVTLSADDLNLLLDYGLSRLGRIDRSVDGRIDVGAGTGTLQFTWVLPANPLGRFVNLSVGFRESEGTPRIDSVRLGRVPIPAWIANGFAGSADRWLRRYDDYATVREAVSRVALEREGVRVVHRWDPALARRFAEGGRAVVVPGAGQKGLDAYARRIAVASHRVPGSRASLAELLPSLFELAAERSRDGGDPRRENEAAVTVLGLYATGNDVNRAVGVASGEEALEPKRLRLTLRGRRDLMLHFVVSATLTVSAGSGLADAVGLFKELSDSRGGSGFSFADLAADRAGVRFATMATRSVEEARLLQRRMSGKLQESDFMPPVDDLPEGIMDGDFESTYGSHGGLVYERIEQEIEQRIDACFLYS